MSDSLRIRGQETQVRITLNNQILRTITAVESLTITANVSLLEKDYLGETTTRLDEIFKGASFEMSFDPESTDFLKLVQAIVDRASRRTAQSNVHINIVATFTFPNGQRPRVTIGDCKFNDIPVTSGGRDQYTNVKLSGKVEKLLFAGV